MSQEREQPATGTDDEAPVDAGAEQVGPLEAAGAAPDTASDDAVEAPHQGEAQALLDDPEQLREEARRLHEEALARREEAQSLREEAKRLREEAERLRAEPERLAVEAAALREQAEAARTIVAAPLPDVPADAADPDAVDDADAGGDVGDDDESHADAAAPRKRGIFRRRRDA